MEAAHRVPPVRSDPGDWDTAQLLAWLKPLKLDRLLVDTLEREVRHFFSFILLDVEACVLQDFDGHSFMLLGLDDCIDFLKIPLGAALTLNAIVSELRHEYFTKYALVPYTAEYKLP